MATLRAYYKLGDLELNTSTGNYVVTGFRETTSDKRAIWAGMGDPSRDGRVRTEVSYPNKRFRLTLSIRPQDDASSLESALRALYDQVVRADDENDTLWFYHRPSSDATWTTIRKIKVYHTDCRVPTDERMWRTRQLDGIELDLECEEAWRGDETTLVSAQNIENADDQNRDNYIHISSSNILGDIPALCRITCTSNHGNYTGWRVGLRTRETVSGFTPTIEWEIAGNSYADTDCSNNAYASFSSPSTSFQSCGARTITPTNNYGLFKVFARVKDLSTTVGTLLLRIRWGVTDTANGSPDSVSETVNAQKQVKPLYYTSPLASPVWVDVPLGTVDFRRSTWVKGSYEPTFFSIELEWKRTSGSEGMYVDRLFLMPIDEGYLWGGRTAGVSGMSYDFIASSLEDAVYVLDASDNMIFFPSLDGAPIKLKPGVDNRLYFLWEEGSSPSQSVISSGGNDRQMQISITYVPRYL